MKETTPQCIANCLKTIKGSHPLYRSFGLDMVDSARQNVKTQIVGQLATYYPNVSLNNARIVGASINGHFQYTIEVTQ